MTVLKFEDKHEYSAGGYYWVPNEELSIWRQFLRDIPINRAAGICSGGEVGLFGLLTHVRKELVLVDHSYASLGIAMLKYQALRELGWQRTQELFTCADTTKIHEGLEPILLKLPEKVQAKIRLADVRHYSHTTRDEWDAVSARVKQKSCTKLDWVSFVHGDLTDLVDKGPFDLLYLSNALEHNDRNGKAPLTEKVEALVKPGGYVLYCYFEPAVPHKRREHSWEVIKTDKPRERFDYNRGKLGWTYTLCRIPKSQPIEAVAA